MSNPENAPKTTSDSGRRLSLRLDEADDQRLAALRQRTGQGRSELVRAALQFYETSLVPFATTDEAGAGSSPAASTKEPGDAPEQAMPPSPPKPSVPAPPPARPLSNFDHGVGARVFCLSFDPATGLFDDGPMQRFLTNKYVRRLISYFFQQDGQAYCAVWVE